LIFHEQADDRFVSAIELTVIMSHKQLTTDSCSYNLRHCLL